MYANTRFKKEVNEWGQVTDWVNPGDEVSQDDLKVSDDEWQYLIDSGAVVEEYPDDLDAQTPPVEYFRSNPRPSSVDESTPVEEALPKTATAEQRGEQLPQGDGSGNEGEEKKPGWMGGNN